MHEKLFCAFLCFSDFVTTSSPPIRRKSGNARLLSTIKKGVDLSGEANFPVVVDWILEL